VCSPLEIIARTRDDKGHNWGLLVEFDDPDGAKKRWNIPARTMTGDFGKDVLGPLVDMGLRLAGSRSGRNARNDLQSYLGGFDSAQRARLVTRLGWHDNAFLLPEQQIGSHAEHLHFYEAGAQLPPISEAGSLEQWQQQIGALCVGNHRLAFVVSVAFAGPLLNMLGHESGGFHLYGDSSGGKTTHLQVAASVYGGPRLVRSWRSTDNALESIAAAHSDGLLVLDEIGMCDPRIIGETVYMLGNGTGKARANDRGQAGRQVQEWRLLFLSTGEKTLAQHMADANKELKAGMEVRMLAVPADASKGLGMFDVLNGFEDAAALSDALKARVAKILRHAPHRFPARTVCAWGNAQVDSDRAPHGGTVHHPKLTRLGQWSGAACRPSLRPRRRRRRVGYRLWCYRLAGWHSHDRRSGVSACVAGRTWRRR